MSYSPPSSPPLPTFAIKDLYGPSKPPGLISISRRRYDNTLQSTPDATLLYLDDDDGELITVGSSFELGQRLEEPVPKYTGGLRDPLDGKLVHVFDINHTFPSLVRWRDHEAGTGMKLYPSLESPTSNIVPSSISSPSAASSSVAYPDLPESSPETSSAIAPDSSSESPSSISTQDQVTTGTFDLDLLGGIQEHLSGLANVLQIAATTLQKAADKTRETDTSVVEDILKGVKGILTEVGSFGVEAFKELGADIDTVVKEQSATGVAQSPEVETITPLAEDTAQKQKDGPGCEEATSSDALEASTYYNVEDTTTKVKFDLPEEQSSALQATRPIPIHAQSARPEDSCKVNILKDTPPSKHPHSSILDDSSEDADFTARYPPLTTIRRVRSATDRDFLRDPPYLDDVGLEKARAQREWRARHGRSFELSPPVSLQAERSPNRSPFASPRSVTAIDTTTKTETIDGTKKPLPGAWPDAKNDTVPLQAPPRESSGDFFNRMIGQRCHSGPKPSSGDAPLHRANTTASSNPASRLNGPFDPGFPYEPRSTPSRREPFFRKYRPVSALDADCHKGSADSSQPPWNWGLQNATSGRNQTTPSDVPTDHTDKPFEAENKQSTDFPRSDFRGHRSMKHHRSVPHFHGSSALPYQIMRPRPVGHHGPKPPQRSATDFLSGAGPAMPMPPPMPFTTRPTLPPRPAVPNFWSPWHSSPPTQPPADEGTNVSSVSGYTDNGASSPVSSQSTITRDLDLANNEPLFPSAQPPPVASPSSYRYPTPPRKSGSTSNEPIWYTPARAAPLQLDMVKDKIDECVEQLKMCGFGIDDENLKNRLHVYAVAADGDVIEAVEMIEQDRKMTAPGRFDSV